jgi:dethiobiotin synthetase
MGKCIFVTGTGTDIGKTYVTGLIVKKLHDAGRKAGYYKAAVSGAELTADGRLVPGDAVYVNKLAAIGETQENLVSYVYEEAVSPHLAAQINHKPIELTKIRQDFARAKKKYEYLTMEGSGGIICPLRYDDTCHLILDDMIRALDLGVLVIADAGLGTINSAVLTIEHLQHCQIPVKGIIFNYFHPGDIMEEDNRRMVEALTGVRVIAVVGKGDTELDINVETLQSLYA